MRFPFRSSPRRQEVDPHHEVSHQSISVGGNLQKSAAQAEEDTSSKKTVDGLFSHLKTDHVDTSDAHAEENCSGIDKFQSVVEQVNFTEATRLATRLRIQEAKNSRPTTLGRLQTLRLSCKVVLTPLYGSHNILFPIRFRDGVQWLLKLPFNGSHNRWDQQSAAALTSEVLTMKLIREKTSIPVPRIYSYDANPANPMKCPFILMERIEGVALFHGWFSNKPPGDQEGFRKHALDEVAKAMVQFKPFTFSKAGALQSNSEDGALHVGAYRKVDHFAEYNRLRLGQRGATTYAQQGPFSNQEDYFLTSLDREDAEMLPPRLQSQRKLLRLFIRWFFQATGDSSNFVLTHPDFNLQNILVGDDGTLRGLIDWDGVVAVPECIGCEEYPLWLISDWDPYWWNYNVERELVINKERPGMLPAELEHYRNIYAHSIEAALRKSNIQVPLPAHQNGSLSSRTKISSLARSLYISANEPISLPYNVAMIFDKIVDLTSGEDYEYTSDQDDSDDGLGTQSYEATHAHKPHSSEHLLPGPAENVSGTQILDFGAENRTRGDTNQIVNHLKWNLGGNSQLLLQAPEDATHSQGNRSISVEGISDRGINVGLQQEQQDHDTTTTTHWSRTLFAWVATIFLYIMFIPTWFILLMDWLQSADISPIAASSVGLLFSANPLVSNLAALLLGSLGFARIIDKSFQNPSGDREAHPTYVHFRKGTVQFHQTAECHHSSREPDQKPPSSITDLSPASSMVNGLSLEESHGSSRRDSSFPSCPSNQTSIDNSTQLEATKPEPEDHDASKSSWSIKSGSSAEATDSESTQTSLDVHSKRDPAGENVNSFRDNGSASVSSKEQLDRIRKKWEEDPTYDFGHFTLRNVYNALHKDGLDHARMRRLKIGFQRLLASLDDRFEGFDGLTLV
ncbi:MAG: hypothetical protein Q9196_001893 [Gyalolechia fulgens]